MKRLGFLQVAGALAGLPLTAGFGGRAQARGRAVAALPYYDAVSPIVPIRAEVDRIFRVTVCLRPFRAAGPRSDVERVGDKLVVHNYGHGGSGWSLSWGAADAAVRKAAGAGESAGELAVLGCGALGLTAAITAQRAGMRVKIYAKERFPFVRSARATGTWSPDSRIALASAAAPGFAVDWERMARTSFDTHQSYLGAPGTPVEWTDRYTLSDSTRDQLGARMDASDHHGFAHYSSRLADITPRYEDLELADGSKPFPLTLARRTTSMTFNIADYARQLTNDFLIAGGTIETREFAKPADLAALPERTIVDCTGYGARALWSDESVVPIRGQIAWLLPQEGVNYGLFYNDTIVLARRDGIAVQPNLKGDDTGWNDSDETPDRAAAEAGVIEIQHLFDRMTVPAAPNRGS
jgi:glycine/D-amino acid oxidase-like deaminating enzyme